MESVTSFLRRKGYAVREIMAMLEKLQPTAKHHDVQVSGGGAIEDIFRQLGQEPIVADLMSSRASLKALGIEPQTESRHTLKVPVSAKNTNERTYLYFTRVSKDRWVYFVDRQ